MGIKVGLLGVGPVGDHIVKVLRERRFPIDGELTVMATSERDEILDGRTYHVQKIAPHLFKGIDLMFFAGKEGAKGASMQWGQTAIDSGCIVIDNGGDFRMHPNYPLVIPEVNMNSVTRDTRYICNPNCSTIQMVVALAPLHRLARLRRVIVSTYQSVSGHSGSGIDELQKQSKQILNGEIPEYDPSIFSRPIAFDCIPHIDRFLDTGYTKEEMKLVDETRKIFSAPNLLITSTCVRVPVIVGHCESINAEFDQPMDAERAIDILSDETLSPGIVLIDGRRDDSESHSIRNDEYELHYPTTTDLFKDGLRDAVLVGRVRNDLTAKNAVNLWCVSDNLRKGAATNAVQIAEEMLKLGYLY
ncbi:MAG: aspartate-semialdehyde dehydrogenase [Clostridiales bacterium]|jgi:aspartate-semialdehyde dehydrogenase|nr:aspartate-semialdehyde dehydrogenase [Clostridiales bacterium]